MRLSAVRVNASKVQGEGAFVMWKRLTWGERRDLRQESQQLEGADYMTFLVEFVLAHLAGWNWTDDQGQAIPLPKDAEGLNGLYVEEMDFLFDVAARALRGELELTADALKN